MFIESQPVESIEREGIVARAARFKAEGWRLVVITCILRDTFEITYTFDRNYEYQSVRLHVPHDDPAIPSITASYLAAFTYENELQDLFGLNVAGLALDFKGTFYKTSVPTPWNRPATQAK